MKQLDDVQLAALARHYHGELLKATGELVRRGVSVWFRYDSVSSVLSATDPLTAFERDIHIRKTVDL